MSDIVEFIRNNYNTNEGFTCYPNLKLVESCTSLYDENKSYIMVYDTKLNDEDVLYATYMTVAKEERNKNHVIDIKRKLVQLSLDRKVKVCYSIAKDKRGVYSQEIFLITKPLQSGAMYRHGILNKENRYTRFIENLKEEEYKIGETETDIGFVVSVDSEVDFHCVPTYIYNEKTRRSVASCTITHVEFLKPDIKEIDDECYNKLFNYLKKKYVSVMWYNIGNLYRETFLKKTFQSPYYLNWYGRVDKRYDVKDINLPLF